MNNSNMDGNLLNMFPQFKSISQNPAFESIMKMAKSGNKRVGLAPIKDIANNEIIGIITKFFS